MGEHHDAQIPQRKLLVAHPVGARVGWALASAGKELGSKRAGGCRWADLGPGCIFRREIH